MFLYGRRLYDKFLNIGDRNVKKILAVLSVMCLAQANFAQSSEVSSWVGPEAEVVIVGDSLTSKSYSWSQLLREDYGYHVMVDAQSGRKAADYTFPTDWKGIVKEGAKPRYLVYYLGSNDRYAVPAFYSSFSPHFLAAKRQGFELIVIMPYRYSSSNEGIDLVRQRIFWAAILYGASFIDVGTIVNYESLTADNIHPHAYNGVSPIDQSIAEMVHQKIQELDAT